MIIYIKELDSSERMKFTEKLRIKLKKPIVRNIDDNKKVLIFPDNLNEKSQAKILKKFNAKINSSCKVVISNKLKKLENEIKAEKIKGKSVQKAMLNKILKLTVPNLRLQDIYIVSKKYNIDVVKITDYFVEKVKTVNIVTNEIKKYKKLEENYRDKGILITVTNNKKKSLKRANIIINVDLNSEEISSYYINRTSIIVNLADNMIDKILGFEGIVINNVQIELDEKIRKIFEKNNLYGYFDNSALYESINSSVDIGNKDIKLKEIVGNNGIIDYNEIKKCNVLKNK